MHYTFYFKHNEAYEHRLGGFTDIDECSRDICDNTAIGCENTDGSYHCNCPVGFQNQGPSCHGA